MAYVGWKSVTGGKKNDGDQLDKLYIKPGNTYKVRPLSLDEVYEFFSYYRQDENKKSRFGIGPDPKQCSLASAHDDLTVTRKRVCYVIDREDGKVKLMVAPVTVFEAIGQYAKLSEIDPGDPKVGGDFKIGSTGKGMSTKYAAVFTEKTPITEEEREMLRALKKEGKIEKGSLSQTFASLDAEALNQRLFGELNFKKDNADSNSSDDMEDDMVDDSDESSDDWEDDFLNQ